MPEARALRRIPALVAGLVILGLGAILMPLLNWRNANIRRTLALTGIRETALAELLYAQDWDYRATPVVPKHRPTGWYTWTQRLAGYVAGPSSLVNPDNPPLATTRYTIEAGRVESSFALNQRVQGTFAAGMFPLEDLEDAGATAMFVEAGPAWQFPTSRGRPSSVAALAYGDIGDRTGGCWLYPSTHAGKLIVTAFDGHAETVQVAHYHADAPHDRLYGRIGGHIYNWNGGHPNGAMDTPPRE